MKARISEFKAKLSAYLDAVRRGKTVIVLDRKTPIARVVPYSTKQDSLQVTEPQGSPEEIGRVRGVKLKKRIDLDKILSESRSDR